MPSRETTVAKSASRHRFQLQAIHSNIFVREGWSADLSVPAPLTCLLDRSQVHSQFVNPTRERLKGLLHGTMGLTAGLYVVLALCGYLYAFEDTKVSANLSQYLIVAARPSCRMVGAAGYGTAASFVASLSCPSLASAFLYPPRPLFSALFVVCPPFYFCFLGACLCSQQISRGVLS